MLKIYFAHAISDYNTPYENKCISIIKQYYPDYKIINPKSIKFNMNKYKNKPFISEMSEIFYPRINKCDVLFAFAEKRTNKISSGVKMEYDYANKIGLEVVYYKNKE